MPGELLTVKEAAAMLGVHPNTIRCWGRQGRLVELRVGPRRDRRYERASVAALLTSTSSQDPERDQDHTGGLPRSVDREGEMPYRFSFMGLGRSGVRDTSSRVKEILRDEWGRAGGR